MKSSLKLTALCIVFLTSFYSCTKDCDPPPPSPTPQAPVIKTKTELLVYKPWVVQEAYELENNVMKRYERGASNNTTNYDNDELQFHTAGTGTWKNIFGQTFPFTWVFTNTEKTKMQVSVSNPSGGFTLNYNSVNITDSSFSYSFNNVNTPSGQPALVSVRRVWKP